MSMPSVRDRSISILEFLAKSAEGAALIDISETLDIPRAATHRVLADLKEGAYVAQDREGGPYRLTSKIVALGVAYLSNNGIIDIAQPILTRLANKSGELVRLSVVEAEGLRWVAKAQGAPRGLRYDPDDGSEIPLAMSASGIAYLSELSEETAIQIVVRQGMQSSDFGPGAPQNLNQVLEHVAAARQRGYATVIDAYEEGTSAIAAAIISPVTSMPIGTLSIAGPSFRMSPDQMESLAPLLLDSVKELSVVAGCSPAFRNASD